MGIVAYVVAGFFLYLVNTVFLLRPPEIPWWGSSLIAGIFIVPALICWMVGVSWRGRNRWRRDTGILLLVVAAVDAFMALTLVCMLSDPGLKSMVKDDLRTTVSHYGPASACLAVYMVAGLLLLRSDRTSSGLAAGAS